MAWTFSVSLSDTTLDRGQDSTATFTLSHTSTDSPVFTNATVAITTGFLFSSGAINVISGSVDSSSVTFGSNSISLIGVPDVGESFVFSIPVRSTPSQGSGAVQFGVALAPAGLGAIDTDQESVTISTSISEDVLNTLDTFTATARGKSRVDLAWFAAPPNLQDGYRLERSTTSSGPWVVLSTADTTSFTDTGLTADTTYYYRVATYNDYGVQTYLTDDAATFTLYTVAVSPSDDNQYASDNPSYKRGEVFTRTYTLTRTANGTATRQYFNLSNLSRCEILALDVVSGAPTPSQVYSGFSQVFWSGAPIAGTPWVIRVTMRPGPQVAGSQVDTAVFRFGLNSEPEYEQYQVNNFYTVVTTADPTALSTAPSNLAAVANGRNKINLTWDDNSDDELYFSLQRATAAAGPFAEVQKVAAGLEAYTDLGLTAGTTYYYKLAAVNAFGTSAFTSVASAETDAIPAAPTAPTGLTATTLGPDSIYLEWTDAATTETEYRVYRGVVTTGPYSVAAVLAAGTTEFTDIGLQPSATYYYVVASANDGGESRSSEASATTDRVSSTVVQDIGLTHNSNANIDMVEVDGRVIIVSDLDRAIVEENNKAFWAGLKPHRTAATVTDGNGGALTGVYQAYIVLVRKEVGETRSLPSPASTATAELTTQTLTITPDGNNAFDVTAATNVTPIAVTVSAPHGLSTGDSVYIRNVLGNTAANGLWAITVTSTVAFTLTGSVGNGAYTSGGKVSTKVACRDKGRDASGTEIDGANFWEVYLHESNMDRPVRVASLPLDTLTYTTPASLSLLDLQDGTRRPMETLFESAIPPSVARIEYYNNRTHWSGERTIKPTQAEQGTAQITVTNASRTMTCTGWTFTDALYHKELYINRNSTGWFVVDVIDANTIEVQHADPDTNTKGFDGNTASYTDFMFPAKPRRVYRSGFFSGEAQGGITFSPETCPPLNTMESELPFNERNPTGLVTSKDVLMLFSDDLSMYLRGGLGTDESDFSFPDATTIGEDGLLAPNSLAKDSQGNVWGINSQGIFRANQAGITRVGTMANHAFTFQRWYDVGKARGCVGEWFGRDDQFVVAGLTANSSTSDGLDGWIYDSRSGYVCPFSTSKPLTFLLSMPTDTGAIQLVYGNAYGEYGVFLQQGLWTDDVDYTSATPYANEVAFTCSVTSGTIAADRAITIKRFWPHIDQTPLTTAITCTVAIDAKKRNDNTASAFVADVTKSFTTSTSGPCYTLAPKRCQRAVVRFSFPTSRSERIEWSGLTMEGIYHGADA
jgi:fibronectin type 3 domain-containing protein